MFFKIYQITSYFQIQVHIVGVDGVGVIESKVEPIEKLPLPNTSKELKRVISSIIYYHRSIPNLA